MIQEGMFVTYGQLQFFHQKPTPLAKRVKKYVQRQQKKEDHRSNVLTKFLFIVERRAKK